MPSVCSLMRQDMEHHGVPCPALARYCDNRKACIQVGLGGRSGV